MPCAVANVILSTKVTVTPTAFVDTSLNTLVKSVELYSGSVNVNLKGVETVMDEWLKILGGSEPKTISLKSGQVFGNLTLKRYNREAGVFEFERWGGDRMVYINDLQIAAVECSA